MLIGVLINFVDTFFFLHNLLSNYSQAAETVAALESLVNRGSGRELLGRDVILVTIVVRLI